MAGKDAEIKIGADASEVEKAASKAKDAWKDVGSSIRSAFGDAVGSVTRDLGNVVIAQGRISFASQHQQVRDFEAATARLAVASNADLGQMRSSIEATGIAIGKRPGEVAAWTSEVGKLTYSFDGAGKAIRGMSALAAETGRSVEEYKGLAVVLGTVGKVTGDTTHAIGAMHAQADRVGTVGGIAAFAKQIEGLGDTVSHFRIASESDFAKVTGLAAELGKGLSPQAAQRVQQGALGAVAADPIRWSRYLGRDITDEHGQVKDPTQVLSEITAKAKRTFGGQARRVLMQNFGAETGAALFNADFDRAASLAGMKPSTAPQQAQAAYLATDAGKRDVAGAELAQASRELLGSSTKLGSAADALQKFAASNPIASTVGATFAGSLLSGTLPKIGTALGKQGTAGLIGALGKGVGWAGGAGGLALAGTVIGGAAVAAAGVYGIHRADEAAEERHKLEEKERDSAAQSALEQKRIAIRRTNRVVSRLSGIAVAPEDRGAVINAASEVVGSKDATAALQFSRGGGDTNALVEALRKQGAHGDLQSLAKMIADALKEGVRVEVTNTTDTPISASVKAGNSAAAGHQHG